MPGMIASEVSEKERDARTVLRVLVLYFVRRCLEFFRANVCAFLQSLIGSDRIGSLNEWSEERSDTNRPGGEAR